MPRRKAGRPPNSEKKENGGKLQWTNEKPKVTGYYYFRMSMAHAPIVDEVIKADCGCLYFREKAVKSYEFALWAGPIKSPDVEGL